VWAFFNNPTATLEDLGFFLIAVFGPVIVAFAFLFLWYRRRPDRPKD
jgi:hypothetical protein